MPEISRFLGIVVIAVFYREHGPPHFHAAYGDYAVTVRISDGVIKGRFPRRALLIFWSGTSSTRTSSRRTGNAPVGGSRSLRSTHWSSHDHPSDRCQVGPRFVWVRFDDGSEGEIDLSNDLDGPDFEPLKDPQVFAALQVHPELHTIVWPNRPDLAPEFLFEQASRASLRAKRRT